MWRYFSSQQKSGKHFLKKELEYQKQWKNKWRVSVGVDFGS